MITLTLIVASLLALAVAYFAWVGIGHYKEFSEDEDKEATANRLRAIIVAIFLVLLSCHVIIGYTQYTETKKHDMELEKNK